MWGGGVASETLQAAADRKTAPPLVSSPLFTVVGSALDSDRTITMDIGRNEPCPCGSGKKFKRCCAIPAPDPLAHAARAVRFVQETAEAKVVRFAYRELRDGGLDDAWLDFDLTDGALDEGAEKSLFLPWWLYDWEPWELAPGSRRKLEFRLTPARMAISKEGAVLSEPEREFLARVFLTPTSFHEVIASEPNRTVTLRNILLDSEVVVFDPAAASDVRAGDILYARIVGFEGVNLFVGSGEVVIPPGDKGLILDAKKALRKTHRKLNADSLCWGELELRALYLELRAYIVNPRRPDMRNTDGDPMEFHTLTYKLASVEAAIAGLAPVAGDDRERVLAEATRARPGGSKRVAFSWTRPDNAQHGGMRNTVLADFKLNGITLTVEVNSSKRAKKVKTEIAKRLGEQAILVRDDRLSMDEAMATAAATPETQRDRAVRKRDEELEALPEVQAMLAKMSADHYATWADVPLPALKGKTPRAAMKTRDGRERVEALITGFELSQRGGDVTTPHYDFTQLRAALGLPRRTA